MVVVRVRPEHPQVLEARIDPRDLRQLPRGHVVEERSLLGQLAHDLLADAQLAGVDVPEAVVAAQAIRRVDGAERARIERVPAPVDVRLVEVAHERRELVQRWRDVVSTPGRLPGERVQPVRPRGPRHRAEPAIDHAVLGREVIVDRQIVAVVVPHHETRVGHRHVQLLGARGRDPGEVVDEPLAAVRELLVDRAARVIWILRFSGELSLSKVVDRVAGPFVHVEVRVGSAQPVDVGPIASTQRRREGQVPEHVVERAVLEHQHDDVLDLVQPLGRRIGRRRDPLLGGRRHGGRGDVDDLPPLAR